MATFNNFSSISDSANLNLTDLLVGVKSDASAELKTTVSVLLDKLIAALGDAATKDVGTTAGTVAAGDHNHSGVYAPALGVDDNYVTDAEKTVIGNTSGTNTGDQNLSGYVLTTSIDTLAELNAIVTDATLIDTTDARLSDARTPTSHSHGGISNTGAIGVTSGLPVKTGASGVLEVGAFGASAGQFAEGNHTHSIYTPVQSVLTESTTSRTLALTDAHDWIHCTNAGGCNITVPAQATVNWPDGTVIYGDQGAAATVTLIAASGVTINCADTLVTDGQHSAFALVRISSDVWLLTGRLVAA